MPTSFRQCFVPGIALTCALAMPAAYAVPVTWQLAGELVEVSGSDIDADLIVGNAFAVNLLFDTDLAVSNPLGCGVGGTGSVCRFNGQPGLSFAGLTSGGSADAEPFVGDQASNAIVVRNNALFGGTVVDGYSFGGRRTFAPGGEFVNIVAVFRGSENLEVVTDASMLPTAPPAGLLDLGQRDFEICHSSGANGGACDIAYLRGRIDSIRNVPEPASAALFSLAIAGVAALRRRRSRPA